jgi:hypothetical protein
MIELEGRIYAREEWPGFVSRTYEGEFFGVEINLNAGRWSGRDFEKERYGRHSFVLKHIRSIQMQVQP